MEFDPVNPNVASLTFPVWMLVHPTMLSKGHVQVTSKAKELGVPFFTSRQSAERFKGSIPGLAGYVLGVIKDPTELIQTFMGLLKGGITHVTFDQNKSEGRFYPIAALLPVLAGAKPLPPPSSN